MQQRDLAHQGLQLLLAEDNEINQKFAVRALSKAGHSVKVANNEQEAVDAWATENFDAVLIDIQIPVMDGYVTKPIKSKLMLAEIARVLDCNQSQSDSATQ